MCRNMAKQKSSKGNVEGIPEELQTVKNFQSKMLCLYNCRSVFVCWFGFFFLQSVVTN